MMNDKKSIEALKVLKKEALDVYFVGGNPLIWRDIHYKS